MIRYGDKIYGDMKIYGDKIYGVGNIQVRNILSKKILRVGKYSVGQALS